MKIEEVLKDSITIKYMKQAIIIMETLENDIYKLNEELSSIDKRRTDILHWLENEVYEGNKLHPTKHFYILKELQTLAVNRRKVKLEISMLSDFLKNKSNLLNANQRKKLAGNITYETEKDLHFVYKTFDNIEDIKNETGTLADELLE